ncbi:transposase [Candidatus Microgenomates bacterium]|nr:transposase [Candidatus Microgenomates bacterium]
MPSRNIIKLYLPDTFYHVYNRGVEKRQIFLEDEDYNVFLNLFKRHLSRSAIKDFRGRTYQNLSKAIELLAYCLMPNHFHLLFYQRDDKAMTDLMRRVSTAYSLYFNKKYSRVGGLFESVFKASDVDNERYLWHISRYIHINPLDFGFSLDEYPFSSYGYYIGKKQADWIKPKRILELHKEYGESYREFVNDFADYRMTLDEVKLYLA